MLVLAEAGQVPSPPWDTPAAVKAHIANVLPGTTFDAQNVGRFVRRTYSIEFHVSDRDLSAMEVAATDPSAESAVWRVAQKAGWTVLDFETGRPISIPGGAPVADPIAARPVVAPTSETAARWKIAGALLAAIAVGAIGVVRWMNTVPEPPTMMSLAPASAPAEDDGGGIFDIRLRDKDGKPITAEHAATIADALTGRNSPEAARAKRLKRLAPAFRENPAVHQILDYVDASLTLQERFQSKRWISPTALASPMRAHDGLTVPALLPPAFRADRRDGYLYTFEGSRCSWDSDDSMHSFGFEVQLCNDAVYSAVPLVSGTPSFAYFMGSGLLHYRADGRTPTREDAQAADVPATPATSPASAMPPAPAPGWVKTMFAWYDLAIGTPTPAPVLVADPVERPVEAELRAFGVAQKLFADLVGRGHFTSVQRLQDHMFVDGRILPPPLPATFATARRHGYRFEFIGTPFEDEWTKGDGSTNGPYHESYIYVAVPDDSSGRTMAIFPDGFIRVATGRQPTTTDPILRASK